MRRDVSRWGRAANAAGVWWKSAIIGSLLALTTLLSGCSALRFSYNQAPDLGYWWLDRYLDFNDAQKPQVREAIGQWFRWNRSTQLADYAQLLQRMQAEVQQPTTPVAVCAWYQGVADRVLRAYDHAVPLMAEVVPTLQPNQFARLEKKYAKNNADFRDDYLQPDPQDRLEASLKRAVDQAETLYGSVSPAQRELLSRSLATSPFDPELWLTERKARQRDIIDTLHRVVNERLPAEQVREALRGVGERVARSPRPAYLAYQERLAQFNCALGAQLHNLATAQQRATAVKKLKGWEGDLRALMAEGA